MKAVRVHQFGGLEAMQYEDIERPTPNAGQVLVRVEAAGVGPWDAWIREGKSALPQPLPLTLGSDLAGVVEEVGPDVCEVQPGQEIFGVTNARFTEAYADYALAEAARIAPRPVTLSTVEAASVPVIAVTAWQMLFNYGQVDNSKTVCVLGGGGNVGAYAVQLAKQAGAEVIATVRSHDVEYVRSLGAEVVIDADQERWEDRIQPVDVVVDTVGGAALDRAFDILKLGGILVSAVATPDQEKAIQKDVRSLFFIVDVTTECLKQLAEKFDTGQIRARVGDVLPLSEARQAHEMLAGKPHKPGKIVLLP